MGSEKMSEADQTTMLMALQKELAEMKRVHEEATRKNKDEITNLQKENQVGLNLDPTN